MTAAAAGRNGAVRAQRESHPAAELFPLMEGSEFDALVEDIRKHGVREPIVLDSQGRVLDGRNRLRACETLGIRPPCRTWDGKGSAEAFVISLNLHRRHLSPLAWAQMFERYCAARGVRTGSGRQKNGGEKTATVAVLAEELNVPARTARRRLKLAADLRDHPDLAQKVDRGDMDARRAQRVARERRSEAERSERAAAGQRVELPPEAKVITGDFRQVLRDYPDGSIDAIITDPPYDKDSLPLWDDLGREAARLLKPGRVLVAYCGQFVLYDAIEHLRRHLTPTLFATVIMQGPHTQLHAFKTRVGFRPVLIFAKGKYEARRYFSDVMRNDDTKSKVDHDWQQGVAPFEYLVDCFTLPGETVLDPFAGSGTTLVAALRQGRRAIGVEIKSDDADRARRNVSEAGVKEEATSAR